MGSFTINGTAHERDIGNVDPRLVYIMRAAAAESPYDVELFSGIRYGGGKSRHDKGLAVDIVLRDPKTGQEIPNLAGGGAAFEAYEKFAQAARGIQKQTYPELDNEFRWGGYFSPSELNPSAFDSMHFDLRPGAPMAYGSWDSGLNERGKAHLAKLGAGKTYSEDGIKAGSLPSEVLTEVAALSVPDRFKGIDPNALDVGTYTLLGEASGEGREGMLAVANNINNRQQSPRYPSELIDVALQPGQYSTWNEGEGGNNPRGRYSPDDPEYHEAKAAMADVMSGRVPDPLKGGTAYYAPKGMKGGKAPYWWGEESKNGSIKIGNHRFALGQKDPLRNFQQVDTPTTALAAIEEVAPSVPDKPQRLAYAQEPTVKPKRASIFDMASAANNAKLMREGKANKFSSAGVGVQKVASAIGNSLIDTGQSIYDAGRNTVSGMVDALQPDEPKKTYRKATAADLWRLGVARPTNHMTPTGEQAPIKTPTAAVAELSAPAPIAPTQGLQDQKKNPLQQAQASVAQMLAPIMNVRHDIGGQFDGMRLGAADTVQGMLQNAFDRPSYNVSPDQALAGGAFLQPNGYYYTGNKQDGFTQVGKQQGDVAKMWADTRKKPKGYTYFDQVAEEWKDV